MRLSNGEKLQPRQVLEVCNPRHGLPRLDHHVQRQPCAAVGDTQRSWGSLVYALFAFERVVCAPLGGLLG